MIFGIHPEDKDLHFLGQLNVDFERKYSVQFKYLRLETNHKSHERCLNTLKKATSGLVLFFCHGLDKTIRGCHFVHDASSLEHKDFTYGPLISPSKNLDVFKGKNVFCLACNSRELGPHALQNGAKVYLGFGDIFFFVRENFKQEKISALTKTELKNIIAHSLNYAIENNSSFNDLSLDLIRSLNNRIFELLNDEGKGRVYNVEVSKALSKIKNGITIFGNGQIKILDFG